MNCSAVAASILSRPVSRKLSSTQHLTKLGPNPGLSIALLSAKSWESKDMSSFLTGAAAQLVGAGVQAVGAAIPVAETSARLLDGMRDYGLPVPPSSWFKVRGAAEAISRSAPSAQKDIYSTLEYHLGGLVRLAGPAAELRKIVVERSKSAERPPRENNLSAEEKSRYYTPQKCSSRRRLINRTLDDSPKNNMLKTEAKTGTKCKKNKLRARSSQISDEQKDECCLNCFSRSKSLIQLACGRLICSKCDKAQDHEQKSNMAENTKKCRKNSNTQECKDVIDLTDSPSNSISRFKRSCSQNNELIVESVDMDSVIIVQEENATPNKRQNKRQKLQSNNNVVINLDDTVALDDTDTSENISKSRLQRTENNKSSLFCPICLENLKDENMRPMTTPCGHVFCFTCLRKVSKSTKKCSICQRPISFAKCIRLHI